MRFTVIDTPLGAMVAAGDTAGLRLLAFAGGDDWQDIVRDDWQRDDAFSLFADVRRQLLEYLAGERQDFDLPLAPEGSEFQQKVWARLQAIPFGETRSYVEIARALEQPGASRAVGTANGRNPIPIIIPCHRVVAADGTLGGYSGGLEMKRRLLEIEGALSQGRLL